MELEALLTIAVANATTVLVPTGLHPLPDSTPKFPSFFKFHNYVSQTNPRYGGLFADPLSDDIHTEQLSGCCRSDKTILPVKLDLFFL
ncbi:hypothetical protein TNCV_52961 [Trichonephila clavipes]|nr:hypothetical protein TNCV_52961 [Trichonephila clavipes]